MIKVPEAIEPFPESSPSIVDLFREVIEAMDDERPFDARYCLRALQRHCYAAESKATGDQLIAAESLAKEVDARCRLRQNAPEIGDETTVFVGSDCYPYTVVDITASRKTVTLQGRRAKRLDKNGQSESQEWATFENPDGPMAKATLRKDGCYRIVRGKQRVIFGYARMYQDPSF